MSKLGYCFLKGDTVLKEVASKNSAFFLYDGVKSENERCLEMGKNAVKTKLNLLQVSTSK